MQLEFLLANMLPFSNIRRSTGASTPHAAPCSAVAGLWSRQHATGVRGHSQSEESAQGDAIEAT